MVNRIALRHLSSALIAPRGPDEKHHSQGQTHTEKQHGEVRLATTQIFRKKIKRTAASAEGHAVRGEHPQKRPSRQEQQKPSGKKKGCLYERLVFHVQLNV